MHIYNKETTLVICRCEYENVHIVEAITLDITILTIYATRMRYRRTAINNDVNMIYLVFQIPTLMTKESEFVHIIHTDRGVYGTSLSWQRKLIYCVCSPTGLDPAGPLIGAVCPAGLQSGDAEFVHIIHTDRGVYGTSLSCGDFNIFFNRNGYRQQPGCPCIIVPLTFTGKYCIALWNAKYTTKYVESPQLLTTYRIISLSQSLFNK